MAYQAVKRCIYCGIAANPNGDPLGKEHIIPESFGGNLILPSASCRKCEAMTSAVETHCLTEMISTARPHLGIKGKQRSSFNQSGPVYYQRGPHIGVKKVPLDSHPGALMIPVMPPAKSIQLPFKAHLDTLSLPPAVDFFLKAMTDDIRERALAINMNGLQLNKSGQSALEFYRLIAKIAHSYTVAELGMENFEPALLNLIRCELPMFADNLICSSPVQSKSISKNLHEVSFSNSMQGLKGKMLIVRIRLFASLGAPIHYAVSGVIGSNFQKLTFA